jgi:hypothetical protein
MHLSGLDIPDCDQTSRPAKPDICGRVPSAETKAKHDDVLRLVGRELKIAELNHKINEARTSHKARSTYRKELTAITHGFLGAV